GHLDARSWGHPCALDQEMDAPTQVGQGAKALVTNRLPDRDACASLVAPYRVVAVLRAAPFRVLHGEPNAAAESESGAEQTHDEVGVLTASRVAGRAGPEPLVETADDDSGVLANGHVRRMTDQ